MIFLLRNGDFKVCDPYIEENKFLSKIERYGNDLVAVMIESSTKLHSDVFTIVTKKHFQTKITPMEIHYTLTVATLDEPIGESNVMERTLSIETVIEFYQAAALLYQLIASDQVGDMNCLGENRAALIELQLHFPKSKTTVNWDPTRQSAKEFINQYGLICDTDDFLDASSELTRQEMLERGYYTMKPNKCDGVSNMVYQFYRKKYFLFFRDGKWKKQSNGSPRMEDPTSMSLISGDLNCIYGICINDTGLLYMASFAFMINFTSVEESTLELTYGEWNTVIDRETQLKLTTPTVTREPLQYSAFDNADLLYMALYLPQYWDIIRYLYGDTPVHLQWDIIMEKHYFKSGEYTVSELPKDQGLDIDLFAFMSYVFSLRARNMRFNET